jgi:hypothetical protein
MRKNEEKMGFFGTISVKWNRMAGLLLVSITMVRDFSNDDVHETMLSRVSIKC